MSIENSDSEKPISADASDQPNSVEVNSGRTNGVDANNARPGIADANNERPGIADAINARPGIADADNERPGIADANDVRPGIAVGNSSETDQDAASSESLADAPPSKVVYRVDQPETPLDEETLLKLLDDNNAPPAPTESYAHPVTGREVYVPKNSKALGPSALLLTAAMLMFVGGALATASMVARAFDIHGQALLIFVIASSAFILSLAGGLLVRTLGDGDKWWVGAGVGACFGAMGAVIVYLQTRHYTWWQ